MLKTALTAIAVAAALGFTGAAPAASETDLKELREQLRQLKEQYEKRIEALEKRLQDAEASLGNAAAAQATQAGRSPGGENALNPGVSLVLNGVYSNLSQSPAGYRISGFVPTLGEVAPPARGLSLGESELAFAANIDPYFRGTLIAAVSPENDRIGIEEAYLQTLSLSNGFTVKAGRFFSGVGYQNQVHAHAWDFADAPLANKAFLGNQLADDGVRIKWVAPTEIYLDLGVDLGRGRKFPAGPDGGRDKNGIGAGVAFAHVGADLGASTAWQVGLSHLNASPQNRGYSDSDSTGTRISNSFSGRSRLWAVDGILKWAPSGNPTQTNFKLQGEYFRRSEDGELAYDIASASRGARSGGYAARQSGWYLQGVYQFAPTWRAGYRYDRLSSGNVRIGLVDSGALAATDFPVLGAYNPTRHTLMADWSPSEFSRVRLQLASDRSRAGATDNQLLLQYIVSLGAHGAHAF